jgi:hypothetical protein
MRVKPVQGQQLCQSEILSGIPEVHVMIYLRREPVRGRFAHHDRLRVRSLQATTKSLERSKEAGAPVGSA